MIRKPKPLTPPAETLLITHLDEDGNGIGHHENKKIIVSGALPGEEVRVKITHSGNHTSHAVVTKVITPSPDRLAKPPCEKAKFCDGCPFISMKYEAQLAWKHNLAESEIHRYRSLTGVNVHPVAPSPKPLHYRNSAKLVVAGKSAAPVIGIYRRGSHDVTDIGNCPLHHELINRIVAATRDGIRKGKVPVYNPKTRNGLLRYVVVRVSEANGKAMVVFVTVERSFNEIHHLAKYVMAAIPEVAVAVQNINASSGNVILGQKDHFLTKEHNLMERIGSIRFSVSPRSFFQVNTGGAGLIYNQVRTWAELTGKEEAVDIYCGIGGISLFLAKKAARVTGIEVVEPAVADAEENARINGIGNCEFIAGDAAANMHELQEEGAKPDLVVLNPPRKGCDEAVLQSAAHMAPRKIIYVSCSPKTLARDLDILSRLGYTCREVQPVDMFPQTPHVENVALLVREEGHQATVQTEKPAQRAPERKRQPVSKKR